MAASPGQPSPAWTVPTAANLPAISSERLLGGERSGFSAFTGGPRKEISYASTTASRVSIAPIPLDALEVILDDFALQRRGAHSSAPNSARGGHPSGPQRVGSSAGLAAVGGALPGSPPVRRGTGNLGSAGPGGRSSQGRAWALPSAGERQRGARQHTGELPGVSRNARSAFVRTTSFGLRASTPPGLGALDGGTGRDSLFCTLPGLPPGSPMTLSSRAQAVLQEPESAVHLKRVIPLDPWQLENHLVITAPNGTPVNDLEDICYENAASVDGLPMGRDVVVVLTTSADGVPVPRVIPLDQPGANSLRRTGMTAFLAAQQAAADALRSPGSTGQLQMGGGGPGSPRVSASGGPMPPPWEGSDGNLSLGEDLPRSHSPIMGRPLTTAAGAPGPRTSDSGRVGSGSGSGSGRPQTTQQPFPSQRPGGAPSSHQHHHLTSTYSALPALGEGAGGGGGPPWKPPTARQPSGSLAPGGEGPSSLPQLSRHSGTGRHPVMASPDGAFGMGLGREDMVGPDASGQGRGDSGDEGRVSPASPSLPQQPMSPEGTGRRVRVSAGYIPEDDRPSPTRSRLLGRITTLMAERHAAAKGGSAGGNRLVLSSLTGMDLVEFSERTLADPWGRSAQAGDSRPTSAAAAGSGLDGRESPEAREAREAAERRQAKLLKSLTMLLTTGRNFHLPHVANAPPPPPAPGSAAMQRARPPPLLPPPEEGDEEEEGDEGVPQTATTAKTPSAYQPPWARSQPASPTRQPASPSRVPNRSPRPSDQPLPVKDPPSPAPAASTAPSTAKAKKRVRCPADLATVMRYHGGSAGEQGQWQGEGQSEGDGLSEAGPQGGVWERLESVAAAAADGGLDPRELLSLAEQLDLANEEFRLVANARARAKRMEAFMGAGPAPWGQPSASTAPTASGESAQAQAPVQAAKGTASGGESSAASGAEPSATSGGEPGAASGGETGSGPAAGAGVSAEAGASADASASAGGEERKRSPPAQRPPAPPESLASPGSMLLSEGPSALLLAKRREGAMAPQVSQVISSLEAPLDRPMEVDLEALLGAMGEALVASSGQAEVHSMRLDDTFRQRTERYLEQLQRANPAAFEENSAAQAEADYRSSVERAKLRLRQLHGEVAGEPLTSAGKPRNQYDKAMAMLQSQRPFFLPPVVPRETVERAPVPPMLGGRAPARPPWDVHASIFRERKRGDARDVVDNEAVLSAQCNLDWSRIATKMLFIKLVAREDQGVRQLAGKGGRTALEAEMASIRAELLSAFPLVRAAFTYFSIATPAEVYAAAAEAAAAAAAEAPAAGTSPEAAAAEVAAMAASAAALGARPVPERFGSPGDRRDSPPRQHHSHGRPEPSRGQTPDGSVPAPPVPESVAAAAAAASEARVYSGGSGILELDEQRWLAFCAAVGLAGRSVGVRMADLRLLFWTVNREEEKNMTLESIENNDFAFVRFEFMEALIRVAFSRYVSSGLVAEGAEATRRLLAHLQAALPPLAQVEPNAFRRGRLYTAEMEVAVVHNLELLTACYKLYKARDRAKYLAIDHWMSFMETNNLLAPHMGVSPTDARLIFAWSQMVVVDELKLRRKAVSLQLWDFIEAVARLADRVALPAAEDMDRWMLYNLNIGKNTPLPPGATRVWAYCNALATGRSGPGLERRPSGSSLLSAPSRPLAPKFRALVDYLAGALADAWGGANTHETAQNMLRAANMLSGGVELA
ncbi:hypothetical protein HYH03_015796 [Edaphochlamys debaryana]|uniref:Uncharacterized protein n=1 Tax=Edaphochlamys debaryana TaxID=47281 RepID=A0A835XT65_9CHLO|nr:hypothetical protein HYH03_015796 [Edaphochlamys debaryana]|eukprot:KAG2485524.1 hypothetical protein HYH03_015796 [Edaphochlamys debaryana]